MSSSSTIQEFLTDALPPFAKHCGAKHAAIWSAVGGRWECVAASESGSEKTDVSAELIELLASSSDEGKSIVRDGRMAYPLPRPVAKGGGQNQAWHASVLILTPAADATDIETVNRVAPALQTLIHLLARTSYQHRRVDRLESLLKIANSWYQIREMEPLLQKMAEVATELLHAERATIFLWDRRKKQLVGRPALGVADNELRIPDDTGIVGRVLRTGKAERADSDDPSIAQVEDPASGFRTRNLVCVPLISQRGRTLGAFELLNRSDGEFTMQDETELAELAASAAAAIENCSNYQSLLATRADDEASGEHDLIGDSPAMVKLRGMIDRVAPSDLPVLILGENGTGKEVASRRIHQLSKRSRQPFLAVNCAALTKSLLESELFGHEKGAFTDAHESRAGKFEAATGGILMLDEIGELPLESQSKLLRVLEEQKVVRVGGTESRVIDTRVIAATNRDLGAMVRDRTFREDLFFRLNVVTLELPPLRERGEDAMLLAARFLEEFCEVSAREVPKFTAAARKRLIHHQWPGNVRELRNVMERLAFLNTESEIDADELPFSEDQADAASLELSLSDATREFQSDYIRSQIGAAGGNMTEAARRLGLHRSNLYRKMGQLGLDDQVDED